MILVVQVYVSTSYITPTISFYYILIYKNLDRD